MSRSLVGPIGVRALALLALLVCVVASAAPSAAGPSAPKPLVRAPRDFRVAHLHVALCDNEHQGIVPVPKHLGDGKDTEKNLYWGSGYGVRSFFRASPHWRELDVVGKASSKHVLQRVAFVHAKASPAVYVVADAYDGAEMQATLRDFFAAGSGHRAEDVTVAERAKKGVDPAPPLVLEAGARADVVAFVGHNGLMDGAPPAVAAPPPGGARPAGAIVVACASRGWFTPHLKKAELPLWVGTTNLLAAEAYSVEAALRAWVSGGSPDAMRIAAGKAYAKYQSLPEGAGVATFATGWAP